MFAVHATTLGFFSALISAAASDWCALRSRAARSFRDCVNSSSGRL